MLKFECRSLFLINEKNPLCVRYFRSRKAIYEEKRRHYNSKFWYIVHPFSRIGTYFDIFQLIFYMTLLVMKMFEFGFMGRTVAMSPPPHLRFLIRLIILLDVLSLVMIPLNFFIGLMKESEHIVVIDQRKIAKHYLTGYFFFDLVSSFPKVLLCTLSQRYFCMYSPVLFILLNTLIVFRVVRIRTVCILIKRMCLYWHIRSRNVVLHLTFLTLILFLCHWMACIRSATHRYRMIFTEEIRMFWEDLQSKRGSLSKTYIHALFRSGAQSLGIYVSPIAVGDPDEQWEEMVVNMISYILGKLVVTATWIVLLLTIMAGHSVTMKYEEIMSQLGEYMRNKQLPNNLRKRMIDYYSYKYSRKFFNERAVKELLSENLLRDINVDVCKKFSAYVNIFAELSPKELSKTISYFKLEIFLPNDIVVQSGTYGDCMYFLLCGTVAVFTHSGREVCHLQEGGYFGEMAVMMKSQRRSATIIAIETTKVFRLDRTDFNKCILKNDRAFKIMLISAEKRLEEVQRLEERYKNLLFKDTTLRTSHV